MPLCWFKMQRAILRLRFKSLILELCFARWQPCFRCRRHPFLSSSLGREKRAKTRLGSVESKEAAAAGLLNWNFRWTVSWIPLKSSENGWSKEEKGLIHITTLELRRARPLSGFSRNKTIRKLISKHYWKGQPKCKIWICRYFPRFAIGGDWARK